MNMGIWNADSLIDSPTNPFVQACRNAAHAIGRHIVPGDIILDVGCGCGDQIMMWINEYKAHSVVGINASSSQAEIAAMRLSALTNVKLHCGVAPQCLKQYKDNSFSVVCSLDSAYHFNTREEFFKQAFRVLRSLNGVKGRLLLFDLVEDIGARSISSPRMRKWIMDLRLRLTALAAGIPKTNLQTAEQYTKTLTRIGFTNVSVQVLNSADDIFLPLAQHIDRTVNTFGYLISTSVALKYRSAAALFRYIARNKMFSMVIVRAEKP